ncbi:glycosyltransferase [Rhodococcus opacus]|uniref:glycosyltransferase n=1 Tax=Rhodococcus opacus TaxID=37919 RepID=UPI0009B706EB|nr:glycosyltransferase [Rhodococcus opacus]
MASSPVSIDVVVVCFNSDPELLTACLSSVKRSYQRANVDGRIILVDNNSEVAVEKSEFSRGCTIVTLDSNVGFGAASNVGVQSSTADCTLILNPDACISDDALLHIAEAVADWPSALFCGWLEKSGSVQVDAFYDWEFSTSRLLRRRSNIRRLMAASANSRYVPVEKVCGGALFALNRTLLEFGPFDSKFFLYGEDADLSRRAKNAGINLFAVPGMVVGHVGAASQVKYGELVERARADAAIRLAAYHRRRVVSLLQRLELIIITLAGLIVGGKSSSSNRARLARLKEVRRWGLASDRDRLDPRR